MKLLLDEHISPRVASGFRAKVPGAVIFAMVDWEEGLLFGQPDDLILAAAAFRKFTLVTYDQKTITPMLRAWAEKDRHHAGIVFIDEKTIPPANIGAMIRALIALVDGAADWDWKDRVVFLQR